MLGALAVLLAVLVAVAGGGGVPAARAQGPETAPRAGARPLRVMTYNIKHALGNDGRVDLERIASVIRAYDPEILGLQEVDRFWNRSGGVDQPQALARELGMHHCFGANLNHQPDGHAGVAHEYGTLLLSRHAILECSNTLLPRVGNTEQRGLLEAVVNVRGVPLRVLNTHLQPGRNSTVAGVNGRESRRQQILAIAARLDEIGAASHPVVLLGDLNARPTDGEMAPLQARLTDAWVARGSGPGNTASAHPTKSPTVRIDYVFVSAVVGVSRVEVPVTSLTRVASDHYPVVADVALPGAAVGVGQGR